MHLLGLEGIDQQTLRSYLNLAQSFLDEEDRPYVPEKYRGALAGRSVALLFFEPSTRTRMSFELACVRLGGHSLSFAADTSSIQKGETELDTCQNLAAMGVDAFVVRHREGQVPWAIADRMDVPVINGGNGTREHPTQALIDSLVLLRHFKSQDLKGRKIAIIGDIVHSRVARSDVHAFRALGAEVVLTGPPQLLPQGTDGFDARCVPTRDEAIEDADAIVMLRIQAERNHQTTDHHSYFHRWGLDEATLSRVPDHTVVMHPGPVIRGVEISDSVVDGPRSLILQQARYGVAVRQAVLLRHVGKEGI